jgi:hypothetical protein
MTMPWIARDKTGRNPYRLFGVRPSPMRMVGYEGDVREDFTWSIPNDESQLNRKNPGLYDPLSNTENTEIPEADCPVHLEPGEGPVEVKLVLIEAPAPRPFEGAGI